VLVLVLVGREHLDQLCLLVLEEAWEFVAVDRRRHQCSLIRVGEDCAAGFDRVGD
jgi:hypothetical protein